MDYYAHSNPRTPDDFSQWEPLLGPEGHLEAVETRIRGFVGTAFRHMAADSDAWRQSGTLVARWHDLGKFSDAFQQYLRHIGNDAHQDEFRRRVDYSSAGAQHAIHQRDLGRAAHLHHQLAVVRVTVRQTYLTLPRVAPPPSQRSSSVTKPSALNE